MPLAPGRYRLAWRTPLGSGAADIALDADSFRALSGPPLSGSLHHAGDAFAASCAFPTPIAYVFGRETLALELTGRAYADRAFLTGRAREAPGLEIEAELTPLRP